MFVSLLKNAELNRSAFSFSQKTGSKIVPGWETRLFI
jgi:hypothetical protein